MLAKLLNLFVISIALHASSHAATLVSGSLADYIALGSGGGTIGPTRFSDFTLLPGEAGATQFAPEDITVNPLNTVGMPGLQFVVEDSASGNDFFGIRFSYRVSDSAVFGASLAITDAAATGESSVTVVEDLAVASQPDAALIVFRTAQDSELSDQLSFTALPSVTVTTGITLDGGGSGLASLGSATSRFAVPEPSALVLVALASSSVLALRRRRL